MVHYNTNEEKGSKRNMKLTFIKDLVDRIKDFLKASLVIAGLFIGISFAAYLLIAVSTLSIPSSQVFAGSLIASVLTFLVVLFEMSRQKEDAED